MSLQSVLVPVFLQVLLTFVLLVRTGGLRFAAIRAKEVRVRDIALGERAWPARVQAAANAFQNQFELPVLFYALVALALITRTADLLFVAMSWLFVLGRVGHALVHVTSNDVLLRFRIFLASSLVLMLMWLIFAARILLS